MDELTAYFVTTERQHAEEALASLRAQGIPRPVEIVRNVRPLAAAYRQTLDCETPFCLLLDDDTVLRAGVVRVLLDRFRQMRSAEPMGFKLFTRVFNESIMVWGRGGLKLFYTPLLKRVGWPDAPHVAMAQMKVARGMGLKEFGAKIEAGVQRRGSDLDVYKKYLWKEIRARAGQEKRVPLSALVRDARGGVEWLWFAALGVVDAMQAGEVSTSKDEGFLGPIGRTLDFAAVTAADVAGIVTRHESLKAVGPGRPARPAGHAPGNS